MEIVTTFLILFGILFYWFSGYSFKDSIIPSLFFAMIGVIFIFLGLFLIFTEKDKKGYKQGQIDYANGIIKYQKDTIITYKEIK